MYSQITRAISVTVKPFYLEEQSSPSDSHYVWAYHVRIENQGPETVQLRNRYWRITDSMGRTAAGSAAFSSVTASLCPESPLPPAVDLALPMGNGQEDLVDAALGSSTESSSLPSCSNP